MPELLPDHLSSAEFNISDQPTSSKSKSHEVNNYHGLDSKFWNLHGHYIVGAT